jgi:drug/metabolite transporter (DMT)-like permease
MADSKFGEILPGIVFGSLCFVWGSTWLAIKVGLGSLPPFFFAGIRFAIAWGLLATYAFARKTPFPRDGSSWRVMTFLGLTQIAIPYALTFWGEQYMTAGLTALLFATLPFFVAIYAHLLIAGERMTAWKLVGMLTSFIGVTVIFSSELMLAASSFWGGVAVVAASASAACANVVGKKYSESINSTVNVVVQMGIGAVLLTAAGIALERGVPLSLNQTSVVAVFYLAVVGSAFGFIALYWLFTRMEVTRISLFTFITPIVAVLLGWLMLGERVDPSVASGGSLILAGVVLVNYTSKTNQEPARLQR